MRAWRRWGLPGWRVPEFYPSPVPNLGLKHPAAPLLIRQGHESPGSPTATLKGELRRLYKLIHPDLLHNHPAQQATNQKSFQLLQEYLRNAKEREGSGRFVYHFEFYIRSTAGDDFLEKVEVALPPPQTWGRDMLSLATGRALGKLFAACGLAINLPGVDERSSLPNLFQEASELQRQSEASQLNLQQQLSLISNALYIGRGVRVLFRVPVEEADLELQVRLLERMIKALDASTGINLSGNVFVIGNCYKVDVLGRLWVNSEENVELWTQFMYQADLPTANSRRFAAKSRQVKEDKVAQLMGVEQVFADDALAVHPDYLFFLDRVEKGTAEHGLVGGGKFSELPIRVSETEVFSVDESIGCLTVPIRGDLSTLYEFIEQNGDKALGHSRKMKLTERKLEDLRKHVRMKLRLRHLNFDRKLSPDQLMSACTRLSNHAHRLTKYTEGLSLCITDEYQLPSGASGYFVHMKWNFNVDTL